MNNIACRVLLPALLGLAAPLFATSPEHLVGGTVSTATLVATRRTFVTTSAAWSAPAITSTATAYTKVSLLPEHTGVERTFLRMLDLAPQRGRVVRR